MSKGSKIYFHWITSQSTRLVKVVFLPKSTRIAVLNLSHFDETFSNAMCRTRRPFSDELALRPNESLTSHPNPKLYMNTHGGPPLSLSPLISLLTTKRGMMTLATLKIHKKPIYQDSKFSVSTFPNFTLKRGAIHHQHMQRSQTMATFLTSSTWTPYSQRMNKINMLALDTFYKSDMITIVRRYNLTQIL
jgi:hypothetical protein